jgi:hypothetical protein
MRSTILRRFAPVRLGILTFGILMVLIASVAFVPATHAATGDRTITLTLTCTTSVCNGGWYLRAGGISGTLLGHGSMTGKAGTTTVETTTQRAAVDTVNFAVGSSGVHPCVGGAIDYITPGSAFNFTAIVPASHKYDYGVVPCAGAGSSFNMQS